MVGFPEHVHQSLTNFSIIQLKPEELDPASYPLEELAPLTARPVLTAIQGLDLRTVQLQSLDNFQSVHLAFRHLQEDPRHPRDEILNASRAFRLSCLEPVQKWFRDFPDTPIGPPRGFSAVELKQIDEIWERFVEQGKLDKLLAKELHFAAVTHIKRILLARWWLLQKESGKGTPFPLHWLFPNFAPMASGRSQTLDIQPVASTSKKPPPHHHRRSSNHSTTSSGSSDSDSDAPVTKGKAKVPAGFPRPRASLVKVSLHDFFFRQRRFTEVNWQYSLESSMRPLKWHQIQHHGCGTSCILRCASSCNA